MLYFQLGHECQPVVADRNSFKRRELDDGGISPARLRNESLVRKYEEALLSSVNRIRSRNESQREGRQDHDNVGVDLLEEEEEDDEDQGADDTYTDECNVA